MERRQNTGAKVGSAADSLMPHPVQLWQREVHIPGIYDLEVDTSLLSPGACAEVIRQHLANIPAPPAFQRLAAHHI
jgi:chloramphenicol 3-O phosphotransferase